MVVRKVSGDAPPAPSRTNSSHIKVPQLKDAATPLDVLDPFARRDPRSIPVAFADDVEYTFSKQSVKNSPLARPATPEQPSTHLPKQPAQPPASPSKTKKKKKHGQRSGLPAELLHAPPHVAKKRSAGRRWFIEYWVVAFFALYISTVCPNDAKLDHSICRALSTYQTFIPASYLQDHFDNALQHPYVEPVVRNTKPYYDSAVKHTAPVYTAAKLEWKRTVVPALSRAAARAEKWATPYAIAVADAWHERTDPYTIKVQRALKPYRRLAEKYTVLTLQRSVVTWRKVQPHLKTYWNNTRAYLVPHLETGWSNTRTYLVPHLKTGWNTAQIYLIRYVVNPIIEAWQTWGDPQVRKMWARVEELAKHGDGDKPKPTRFGAFAQAVKAAQGYADSAYDADAHFAAENAEAPVAASTQSEPPTASSSTAEIKASAESVAAQSVLQPPASSVATSSTPAVAAANPSSSLSTKASTESAVSASKPPPPSATPSEQQKIEAFLEELLSDNYVTPGQEVSATQESAPKPTPLTPEQIKEKRDAIFGPFNKTVEMVEKMAATIEDDFIRELTREREAVVTAFHSKNSRVVADIEQLEAELTLALTGMSTYLEQLTSGSEGAKRPALWERLVDRVQDKVEHRVHASEEFVEQLWARAQNVEVEIIDRLHEPMRALVDNTIDSISLPLAWLDDVRPADWTRIQLLSGQSKNIRATLVKIQEGDDPRSPADPVIAFFKRTQQDIQDMLGGFEVQFNELRRRANRTFGDAKSSPEEQGDYVPIIGRSKDEVRQVLGHDEL